ncbi:hypothetical protein DFH09DRAFT_1286250 [Mycena vulgaris]|nr:hypothetical protein DFH09DRAFT_1286250 [Mycena vulgaris]
MSVAVLQAHIEEVSTEIERQKEVLQKLEHKKSALKRQLNDVRDPVARLPLEISSENFTLCLPSDPELGARHVPILFLNICSAWAEIFIATPVLWAAIHIEFPCREGFNEVLRAWLKRARIHPLSITLEGTFDDEVATILRRHTENLESLGIYADDKNGLALCAGIGPFPSLNTLTIGCQPFKEDHFSFDVRQLLVMLRHAPNLVECTFDRVFMDASDHPSQITSGLVLPTLRHLTFGNVHEDPLDPENETETDILTYLSLPALETIFLPLPSDLLEDFETVLKRSSPPIQRLIAYAQGPAFGYNQLDKCLRLVPSLTHFEFNGPDRAVVTALFTSLSDPFGFLPNLRSLKIGVDYIFHLPEPLSAAPYGALAYALAVRRPHMTCFELKWLALGDDRPEKSLDGFLLAAFRKLVADGMKIHIGPRGRNLSRLF